MVILFYFSLAFFFLCDLAKPTCLDSTGRNKLLHIRPTRFLYWFLCARWYSTAIKRKPLIDWILYGNYKQQVKLKIASSTQMLIVGIWRKKKRAGLNPCAFIHSRFYSLSFTGCGKLLFIWCRFFRNFFFLCHFFSIYSISFFFAFYLFLQFANQLHRRKRGDGALTSVQ